MQGTQETWVWPLGREDPLSRKWQSNPVFLPGKFHGQRSLVSLQCTHTHTLCMCAKSQTQLSTHTHSQPAGYSWLTSGKVMWLRKLGTTVQSRWWVHGYSLHDFIQLFQMLENFWKKQKYSISLPLREQIMFILSRIDAIIKLSPESESEVTQSCPTLWDPMDCSLPGSSVRGILQARILEWVAISLSRRRGL